MRINNPYLKILFAVAVAAIFWTVDDYINKERISGSSFGVKSNSLRKKLNIPIIEEDMAPHDRYDKSGNRWLVKNEYPGYGLISHIYKFVEVDPNTLKIQKESDAFRRKVNDTVFEELVLAFNFQSDTVNNRRGAIFYLHNTDYLDYARKDKYFNSLGIDSIAADWHLEYLIKGKLKVVAGR